MSVEIAPPASEIYDARENGDLPPLPDPGSRPEDDEAEEEREAA